MNKPKWTHRDEEALQDLQRRKKEFEEAAIAPLQDFLGKNWPFSEHKKSVVYATKLSGFLIKNAETIRDLLEPYDSGERAPAAAPEISR